VLRLVALTLQSSGPRAAGGAFPDFLVDVLWSAVLPGDGLEHLAVRAGPGRVDLGFYLLSPAAEEARATAFDLLRRAVAMSPLLNHWQGVPPVRLHAVDLAGIAPPIIENR
jgi:hypothetical protein